MSEPIAMLRTNREIAAPHLQRWAWLLGLLAVLLCGGGAVAIFGRDELRSWRREWATYQYLSQLDLQVFIERGSNFTHPHLSPLRLGKPLEELDVVFDYDFDRAEAYEKQLRLIDRPTVLAEIYRRICADCKTNTERHLAVLEFCRKASFHNALQPMWREGVMIADPLLLLELGEQRCGQTSRLAVDLFEAGGMPGRLAQLACHVAAEVYYDGDWHYFDPGMFSGADTVFDADGSIPSYRELSRRPTAIDAIPDHVEPLYDNQPLGGSAEYPSSFYFARATYTAPACYWVKMTTPEEAKKTRNYGWDLIEARDADWELHDEPIRTAPGAPLNPQWEIMGKRLTWTASEDRDGDLLGYRVFVSRRPRGWCYGPDWKPSMYDACTRLPPADLGLFTTTTASIDLPADLPRPFYVTVMAYDRHGEQVGCRLYPRSVEMVAE